MKLVDVSVKRPVLATVMVAVLVVFGVSAYPKIGVDQFPDVEFPFVIVTAVYPGADPETIETKVVEKLEEAISTVAGIKVTRRLVRQDQFRPGDERPRNGCALPLTARQLARLVAQAFIQPDATKQLCSLPKCLVLCHATDHQRHRNVLLGRELG